MAQAEVRTGLSPLRDLDLLRAIERFDVNLRAKRRLRDINRQRTVQVVFAALKHGMLGDFDDNVKIAGLRAGRPRIAFTCKPQAGAVIDAGRDIDLEFLLYAMKTLTAALRARLPNDLSPAAAASASFPHGKQALLVQNLTAAVTDRAGNQAAVGFAARPLTTRTRLHAGNLQIGG